MERVVHFSKKKIRGPRTYTGSKRVLMLALVIVLSCVALTLLAVVCYFIVDAVITKNPVEKRSAVVSNGYLCAKVSKEIMDEGGTAVDAAIAALLCEEVTNAQSLGLGGGFLMTIYNRTSGKAEVLNARETAPAAATRNMFVGNEQLSEKGGLAVAVPGQLKGIHEAYIKYGGGVSWKRLFEPAIDICYEGFRVQKYLADRILTFKADLKKSPTLREILTDPVTGKFYVEGDLMRRPELGRLLETIAEEGITTFYEGDIAEQMINEIKAAGGIITLSDLKHYQVQWMTPVKVDWGEYTLLTAPVPGSGEILVLLMNILNGLITPTPFFTPLNIHRFIEACKLAYAQRGEMGDDSNENFVPDAETVKQIRKIITSQDFADKSRLRIKDNMTSSTVQYYGARTYQTDDHGTCHISVLSANGDAVSVTSSINLPFGAKFGSLTLGFVYNNQMADFSIPNTISPFGVPPSPVNHIIPGKRPLSSMSPSIFINNKRDVELIIGAGGGTRIISSIALVAFYCLMGEKSATEAIDIPRIHHQLFPMKVDFENGFPEDVIDEMEKIGHKTTRTPVTRTSMVTAIRRLYGKVTASFDFRRGGSVEM